jgi:hypothetical protein
MKLFLTSHFFSKEAVTSFLHTFVGYLAVDAVLQFNTVLSGNFTKEAFYALLVAVGRSLVKALWNFSVMQYKKTQT